MAEQPTGGEPRLELERASRHDIWPVSAVGDLLVVAPKGDLLGFPGHNFPSEYARVVKLARNDAFANVLVDLGSARYFGSEMIGSLVNLSKAVAEGRPDIERPTPSVPAPQTTGGTDAGGLVEIIDRPRASEPAASDAPPTPVGKKPRGVMGVCNVSHDMQAGFEVMNVDALWRTYEDRPAAEKALATVKVKERIGHHRRGLLMLLSGLAVTALLCVIFVAPIRDRVFPPTASSDFALLESVERRWLRRVNARTSNEELVIAGTRLRDDLSWASRRFKAGGLDDEHSKVAVAASMLDAWLMKPSDEIARTRYESAVREARRVLGRDPI